MVGVSGIEKLFQHTAARRRLDRLPEQFSHISLVSTHSRPKAAGKPFMLARSILTCFNTQPPEGGWVLG